MTQIRQGHIQLDEYRQKSKRQKFGKDSSIFVWPKLYRNSDKFILGKLDKDSEISFIQRQYLMISARKFIHPPTFF